MYIYSYIYIYIYIKKKLKYFFFGGSFSARLLFINFCYLSEKYCLR